MRATAHRPMAVLWLVVSFTATAAAQEKGGARARPSREVEQILERTNAARARAELPPLKLNPLLSRAAQKHTEDMARQQKMDHLLGDKTPADRARAAGYQFSYLGENIAWGMAPADVVSVWLKSKGHRANILNANYTEIGIGVAKDADGLHYFTQKFGRPTSARE